jgi:hypothetical protein
MNKEIFNISFKGGTLEDILNAPDFDGVITIEFGEFFIEHLKYYNPEYFYYPSFSVARFNDENRKLKVNDDATNNVFKEIYGGNIKLPKRLNFIGTCPVALMCSFQFIQKIINLDLKKVTLAFNGDERLYNHIKEDIRDLVTYIKQRTDINKTISNSKFILKEENSLNVTQAIDITTGNKITEGEI